LGIDKAQRLASLEGGGDDGWVRSVAFDDGGNLRVRYYDRKEDRTLTETDFGLCSRYVFPDIWMSLGFKMAKETGGAHCSADYSDSDTESWHSAGSAADSDSDIAAECRESEYSIAGFDDDERSIPVPVSEVHGELVRVRVSSAAGQPEWSTASFIADGDISEAVAAVRVKDQRLVVVCGCESGVVHVLTTVAGVVAAGPKGAEDDE
jgi:hypothetical protein